MVPQLPAPVGPPRPGAVLRPRTRIAAGVGHMVAGLSRQLRRGGGSVVGGRAILALDPGALRSLAEGHQVALVSGTNGKTTTTSLLGAALATIGPLTTNVLGANLPPGLAAALASGPRGGNVALEVDEAWLEKVLLDTQPAVVLLLNLSRDQLDRNNEVRQLAARWRRALEARSTTVVVANADDPLVAWAAAPASEVCWVGAGQPWTEDAAGCPACGGRILFEGPFPAVENPAVENPVVDDPAVENPVGDDTAVDETAVASPALDDTAVLDGWACATCDLRRPGLAVRLEGDEVITSDGWRGQLRLALPGRANRANAAMAMAGARIFGVAPDVALAAMATTAEVVGRYSTLEVEGVRARLLLAKNPAGWLEVLDVLRPPPMPVVVAINARIADGRDPSWLWDVPFEALAGRVVIASGERGRDLAVRLHYAGVEHRLVIDPLEAIAVAGAAAEEAGLPAEIDAVGNYTTFQTLRRSGR